MIAYNKDWLDALAVQDAAEIWQYDSLITEEKHDLIVDQHRTEFYTPNPFVRLGLSVFSAILIGAAFGLFCLILGDSILNPGEGGSICFGILCFLVLEYWSISEAKHYGSGIDDILLYFGLGFVIIGIYSALGIHTALLGFTLAFVLSLVASIRYLDRIVAAFTFGCFIAMVVNLLDLVIGSQIVVFSLVVIVLSAGAYLFAVSGQKKQIWRYWGGVLQTLEILSLCTFYAAGNYWVVNETSTDTQNSPIPVGFIFWIFTFIVPLAYIYFGLFRKDRILLDIGLILMVATICSVRFYFEIMPFSWFMTIGGAILFAGAYFAIKYLKDHETKFTYERDLKKTSLQRLEEQIISSTVVNIPSETAPPTSNDKMGGGHFGGGGASGEF